MNTDDIVESMLACKETDFSAILALSHSLANHPDVNKNQLNLVANINHVGSLLKNHCVGEGILVGENEDGLIDCITTYGLADYSYITDNGHFRDNSYRELMIDLIGSIKDGDIKLLDLFLRRNTRPLGAIEVELDYVFNHGGKDIILQAVDKYDLSSLMELSYDEDGEEDCIMDWFDRIYGILPRCDRTVGQGDHYLITQCDLYDTVTKTRFDHIEEVIDTMLHDTVIYLNMLPK